MILTHEILAYSMYKSCLIYYALCVYACIGLLISYDLAYIILTISVFTNMMATRGAYNVGLKNLATFKKSELHQIINSVQILHFIDNLLSTGTILYYIYFMYFTQTSGKFWMFNPLLFVSRIGLHVLFQLNIRYIKKYIGQDPIPV